MNQVKPALLITIAEYLHCQSVPSSVRVVALAIMALLISERAGDAADPMIVVQPTKMVITAMVNDPVVLRLEVTTMNSAADIDLKANGLRIQREIHSVDPTHRVFLIEPDTSQKGRVNGQLEVVDKTGTVLCAVPMTGEVKPYIRVSPAHIFLGSLEYGTQSDRIMEHRIRLSAESDWELLGIDAAEIPNARWEIKNEDAETKVLLLRFSEDAFKANKPFGAFIKRTIRLKTNSATQPEVSIVIEGMLSRNGTKRNFNTFVFKGNERWQGKWGTPNLAAAVLGPIVLLGLGYGVWLTRVQTRHLLLRRVAVVGLCFCAVAVMFLLARTYSRGGWLAFGVGLGLMVALMKQHRSMLGTGAAVFILIVAFLPAGMQRAVSVSAIGEDPSISHRLLVWRGALEMIADHPIYGVSAGQFGQVFQTYYQEPWHKDEYITAISDYLTLAAEHGVVFVLPVVVFVVCLAVAAIGYSLRYGDAWLVPIIGALVALGAASIFSDVGFVWEVQLLYWTGVGGLAIYCGVKFVLERRGRRDAEKVPHEKIWLPAAGVGVAVGCLLGGAVICAALTRPASCSVQPDASRNNPRVPKIEYLPGRMVPRKGALLFLPASPESLTVVGRQILRPLAENGWRSVTLDLCMYDQEATRQVVDALRDLEGPTLVLAEGTRARVAVMAEQLLDSKHRPKLIFVDPVLFSALGECDQSKAQKITSGAAVISGERWQAFKQNGRSSLGLIIKTYDSVAHRERAFSLDGLQAGSYARPAYVTVPASATTR